MKKKVSDKAEIVTREKVQYVLYGSFSKLKYFIFNRSAS